MAWGIKECLTMTERAFESPRPEGSIWMMERTLCVFFLPLSAVDFLKESVRLGVEPGVPVCRPAILEKKAEE